MNKWIIGGAAVVVVAAGAGYYGLSYYGSQRAEHEFKTRVRPLFPPGAVSHGAIRYSPAGDRLDIDEVFAQPEARGLKSVKIAHLAVGGVTSQRLDSVVASKVVLESQAGNHAEIDEIAATDVDVPTVTRLVGGPPAGQAAAADTPPMQGLSLSGVKTRSEQIETSAERISLTGLKSPLPPVALDSAATPEAMTAWLAAFTLDKAEIAGVDVRAVAGNKEHTSLHRIAVENIGPGRVGAITLEALAVEAKDGQMKLGSATLAGVTYRPRSAKARVSAAALGLPNYDWMPGRVFFERFAVGDVTVNVPNATVVTLKDVHATMAGSIVQATAFDLQLNEFSVDLSKVPPSPLGVSPADLGISNLVVNVDVKSTYDPATKVMEIPRYAFVLPKLGSLTMAASLGDLVYDDTSDDPMVAMQRILAATLRHFEIRYDDDSLASRLFQLAAKQGKSDVETVRTGVIAQLEQQKAAMEQSPEIAAMLDVIIAFLKEPHTITVVVAPPNPLPLATFATLSKTDPSEVPKLLGLSIK